MQFLKRVKAILFSGFQAMRMRVLRVARYKIPNLDRWGLYLPVVFVVSCWVYWKIYPVLPGYCIAALAFAAVIMTVRADKFSPAERVIWVLIGGALMFGEVRVLYLDREANDRQVGSERQTQIDRFNTTTSGLTAAIDGIKSTLITADQTLIQTSPKAAITVARNYIAIPPKDGKILPGVKYAFDTDFVDKGNDSATIRKELVGIYGAKEDDISIQKDLASRFEKDWKKKAPQKGPILFVDVPVTTTTFKVFDPSELGSDKTIYFLFRVNYSDSSGLWGAEDCEAYQIGPTEPNTTPSMNQSMFHYCKVFRNPRYPIKRR